MGTKANGPWGLAGFCIFLGDLEKLNWELGKIKIWMSRALSKTSFNRTCSITQWSNIMTAIKKHRGKITFNVNDHNYSIEKKWRLIDWMRKQDLSLERSVFSNKHTSHPMINTALETKAPSRYLNIWKRIDFKLKQIRKEKRVISFTRLFYMIKTEEIFLDSFFKKYIKLVLHWK